MKYIKFPHVFRKIPAWTRKTFLTCLWLSLMGILSVNLVYEYTKREDKEKQLREMVLAKPFNPASHERLAAWYVARNREAAGREYLLADTFFHPSADNSATRLGVQSSPAHTWQQLNTFIERINEDIVVWEKVWEIAPDYQYANGKLAVLYYQLGERGKSKMYLAAALRENPIDKTLLILRERLK